MTGPTVLSRPSPTGLEHYGLLCSLIPDFCLIVVSDNVDGGTQPVKPNVQASEFFEDCSSVDFLPCVFNDLAACLSLPYKVLMYT